MRKLEFALDVAVFDFAKALGLSAERTVKKAIGSRRRFAALLPPHPRAHQGIRRLRELGEVFRVTTPWETNPRRQDRL